MVLLVITFLVLALLPRQTEKILQIVSQPIADLIAVPIEGLAWVDRNIREAWNRYLALQGVYEQNLLLREKVQVLQGEINSLREEAMSSERLAALLEFKTTSDVETIAARIIGRNASNWYQTVVLDKGEEDGIEIEMGAITPAGVVGQVVKVASSTSIVLLLTDPNVAIPGLVQRTRDEGIVQGTSQGLIHMKYIPPLSPIQKGDTIVTSGLTEGFSRGILIGQVQAVQTQEGDLFQSATLSPSVNFSKLEEVLIITSPKPTERLEATEETLTAPDVPRGNP